MDGKELISQLKGIDFKALSSYRTELLGVAILVALSFLLNTHLWQSSKEQMQSLKAEILTKKSELVIMESKSNAIAGLKKSVKSSKGKLHRVEARLASLKERLPSTSQISNLLVELSGEGGRDNIHVLSIKPMAVEDKGELIRLPFQVNVESAFFSFGDYIKRLENLERVMVIENFKIEKKRAAESTEAATEQLLASQVYLSAYILGPVN